MRFLEQAINYNLHHLPGPINLRIRILGVAEEEISCVFDNN